MYKPLFTDEEIEMDPFVNISEQSQIEKVVVIPLRKKNNSEKKGSQNLKEKMLKKKARNVICNDCNLSFANESILEGHIARKHSKIGRKKKWKCTECNESFLFKDQLEYHMNSVHLKVKPYECDSCPKCFATNSLLMMHINRVHVKVYKCKYCMKAFH